MTDNTRHYSIYKITNELVPNETLYSMSLLGRAGVMKTCKNMLRQFLLGKIDKDTDFYRILTKETKFAHLTLEFVEGGLATKDDAERRKKELMTPPTPPPVPSVPPVPISMDLRAKLLELEAEYTSQISDLETKIDAVRRVIGLL